MSAPTAERPATLLISTARTVTAGFVVLAAGLAAQLWRHNALLGGRVARDAIPHDDRGWELPHFIANGVSIVGGTVIAPALLLALAAVIAIRAGRWTPLAGAVGAVVLVDVCLAVGKLTAGQSAVSGPATVSIVCWGVAAWLLHDRLRLQLRRALHWLAASAALVIGVAQLYLGHPLLALLASWALGVLISSVYWSALRAREC
jgi:hypothetical protein